MGNQTLSPSPTGTCLVPALLKRCPPAFGLPRAQEEPFQQLSHPGVPGSGGSGMLLEERLAFLSAGRSSVEH